VLRAADAGHALCGGDDWHECGARSDLSLARRQEMGTGAWRLGADAGGGGATRVERERAAWLRRLRDWEASGDSGQGEGWEC
jgi:hypothetical protein